MQSITVKEVQLYPVALPRVERLRTSFGDEPFTAAILAAVHTEEGVVGWGEASVESGPGYSYETMATALHIMSEFLIPLLVGQEIADATDVPELLKSVRGHPMARFALETAVWDELA